MKISKLTLKIIKEENMFVVRSVEYDIASQGRTLPEALMSWAEVFSTQLIFDANMDISKSMEALDERLKTHEPPKVVVWGSGWALPDLSVRQPIKRKNIFQRILGPIRKYFV